jgi:hypothetical protein
MFVCVLRYFQQYFSHIVVVSFTAASDKVYQLLVHGRWFSPGTPASSTTKTGCHDIAEILLKVALRHQKTNQSIEPHGPLR